MVVCNLRVRVGRNGQQRRFSDVRESNQTHVRQKLQLQNHLMLFARKARLCKARDLTGRCGKMLIAPAAAATLAEDEILRGGHIPNDLVRFRVAHDRAARHLDDEVLTALALAARAASVLAVRGRVFSLIAEIHQGGQIVVHAKDDTAAVSAVAAVGAAGRDVFLAVKRDRAVAAVPGLDVNFCFIDKHGVPLLSSRNRHLLPY